MHARVPLDVDLEDKLIYGLTPTRLAYIVLALLASFAIWTTRAPTPVRASAAIVVATVGAVAAWGRWRGRPVDGWFIDLVLFVVTNYRVKWR